ncbi:DUF4416 family protein [Candidatus Latescibacterota bacterium]
MGKLRVVEPAVLIAGITFAGSEIPESAIESLENDFGPIEFMSDPFVFDMTDYYTAEMGEQLQKVFYCFKNPIDPIALADIKIKTNEIELRFAGGDTQNPSRTINIDPGYVTLSKLILASTKDYSHRIYIGKQIYAETTLRFEGSSFKTIDTTYPDYQTPLVMDFLNRAREYLKENRGIWGHLKK